MIKLIPVVVLALALMIVPSASFAQSSIGGYNDVGGDVQNQVANPVDEGGDDESGVAGTQGSGSPPADGTTTPVASTESLPFTGLDLALLLGAGGLLLGLGLLMRRFTQGPDTA